MKTILIIISCFTAACIISCGKKSAQTNPLPPTAKDSQLVIAETVFTNPQTPDKTKYQFEYDGLKRVTKRVGFLSTNGTFSPADVVTYYYQGSDTLAYKSVWESAVNAIIYNSAYYYYDDSRRLIKDSLNTGSFIAVHAYEYVANKIISAYLGEQISDGTTYPSADTAFLNSNGDFARVDRTNPFGSTRTDFTYDTHPNPYNLLNIRSTFHPIPDNNHVLEDVVTTKYNIISIDNFQPAANEAKFTWTYGSTGYPLEVDMEFDIATPRDNHLTLSFSYKKL